jgi:hypothetical protein
MLPGLVNDRGAPGTAAAVNKLVRAVGLVVVGLAALALAGPTLTRLTSALVPLVLVVGVVAAVLRLTWSYTRKW